MISPDEEGTYECLTVSQLQTAIDLSKQEDIDAVFPLRIAIQWLEENPGSWCKFFNRMCCVIVTELWERKKSNLLISALSPYRYSTFYTDDKELEEYVSIMSDPFMATYSCFGNNVMTNFREEDVLPRDSYQTLEICDLNEFERVRDKCKSIVYLLSNRYSEEDLAQINTIARTHGVTLETSLSFTGEGLDSSFQRTGRIRNRAIWEKS